MKMWQSSFHAPNDIEISLVGFPSRYIYQSYIATKSKGSIMTNEGVGLQDYYIVIVYSSLII